MPFEPAIDRTVGGKYRLLTRLAGGGMGSVWAARHESLEADVAIKFMTNRIAATSSGAARFEREAKATAQLASPHVVRVQDFGVEDDTAYIVLELLKGEDLADRLERTGTLSLGETTTIATSVCKALTVAHDAGLVHRDIKPRNIFLARQGDDEIVKLVDFGVARETATRLVDDETTTGLVLGSPSHMSPEQAASGDVDARSDLWSVGVVLYRCLVGRLPFDGPNVPALVLAIVSAPLVPPSTVVPGLGEDVDRFFVRALARDPARRFQSAREMGKAFAALSGAPGTTAMSSSDASGRVALHVEGSVAAGRGREEPTLSHLGGVDVALTADTPGSGSAPRPRARRFAVVAIFSTIVVAAVVALAWRGIATRANDDAADVPASSEVATAGASSAAVATSASIATAAPSDARVVPADAPATSSDAHGAAAPAESTAPSRVTVGSGAASGRVAPTRGVAPTKTSCVHFDSFTGHCLP